MSGDVENVKTSKKSNHSSQSSRNESQAQLHKVDQHEKKQISEQIERTREIARGRLLKPEERQAILMEYFKSRPTSLHAAALEEFKTAAGTRVGVAIENHGNGKYAFIFWPKERDGVTLRQYRYDTTRNFEALSKKYMKEENGGTAFKDAERNTSIWAEKRGDSYIRELKTRMDYIKAEIARTSKTLKPEDPQVAQNRVTRFTELLNRTPEEIAKNYANNKTLQPLPGTHDTSLHRSDHGFSIGIIRSSGFTHYYYDASGKFETKVSFAHLGTGPKHYNAGQSAREEGDRVIAQLKRL